METQSHYGMIRVIVPLHVAERMLNTTYYECQHARSGYTVVRTPHYSLPEGVAEAVNVVGPTIRFPPIKQRRSISSLGVGVGAGENTPKSLRELYSVGDVEGKSSLNRQACSAFLEQYMSASDLQEFYKLYYPVAEGRTAVIVGPNHAPPGVEANLDIQYITTMGGNITTEFDSFPGRAPDNPANEPFLDMLYYLGNDTNPPWVMSTSYGEDESSVSLDYANSCNTEFQKNGARGISILFASGDSGVGSDAGACTRFVAQWPSASPYVTAVGGTTGQGPETGAGLSSGGFSDRWPQQSWQANAIATFLNTSKDLPDSSRYNASGRGFPDVAAQATGFTIVYGGVPLPGVAGTSCSCPTFSGIVGLLNDIRFSNGKSPLGFLNPFIYQNALSNPTILQDILSGDNPGCGTKGFTAIKGWDPVTGYGTPNYAALAKIVAGLQ